MADFVQRNLLRDIAGYFLYQYSESENLHKYLEVLLEPFNELEQVFEDIQRLRNIDEADTDQLDIFGRIVGRSRGVFDTGSVLFFGMDPNGADDPIPHLGFGSIDDLSGGGIFRSIDQPIVGSAELSDEPYRRTIKAQIVRNTYNGNIEDVIEAALDVLGLPSTTTGVLTITEDFSGLTDTPPEKTVLLTFNRVLSPEEKSLFRDQDVLPRIGGVRYSYADSTGSF